VEPFYTPFQTLIECYVDLSCIFMNILLTDTAPLQKHNRTTVPREIPSPLQKDYRLLQLQAEDSPAQARVQYRELAKRHHPDAGGHHADFLALQQAYERVVQYQQTFSRMSNL